jgi:hypothetical protein
MPVPAPCSACKTRPDSSSGSANGLSLNGGYAHVRLAGLEADGRTGIIAAAGDGCPGFAGMFANGQLPPCAEPFHIAGGIQAITTLAPSCGPFLFTSEILEHKIILCVYHSPSSKYYLVPDWGILFRPNWGILFRPNWGFLFRRDRGILRRRNWGISNRH